MTVNSEDMVAELIQRHGPQIRQIIERRSGSVVLECTTVDDLFQETVAVALKGASTFQYHDDARFIGWMTTIARRTISRHANSPARSAAVTRVKRDESSGVGVFASQIHGRERTPSSVVSSAEAARKLQAAIRSLPEDYRRVVILYKIEERSLGEVSAAMGRSKVATCRLLARAFSKLRKKLEE